MNKYIKAICMPIWMSSEKPLQTHPAVIIGYYSPQIQQAEHKIRTNFTKIQETCQTHYTIILIGKDF